MAIYSEDMHCAALVFTTKWLVTSSVFPVIHGYHQGLLDWVWLGMMSYKEAIELTGDHWARSIHLFDVNCGMIVTGTGTYELAT